MRKHFVWIDDERPIDNRFIKRLNNIPAEECDITGWSICRTGEDAVREIKSLSQISDCKIFVSFDHDLGFGINGYDVAKWIVENEIPIAGFTVHSMNPIGAKNIIHLLTHYGYTKMSSTNDIVTLQIENNYSIN